MGLRALVPLDGSPEAESILPHLLRLFRRLDEAVLFHALPDGTPPLPPAAWLLLPERLEDYLERARARLRGLRTRVLLDRGDPAKRILHAAELEKADVIAMTSHARGGLGSLLLGSVAQEVLDHSRRPLLLVRPGVEPRPDPLRTILVPLDGSTPSAPVLEAVRRLAKARHADVVLLRLYPLAVLADPVTGFVPIPSAAPPDEPLEEHVSSALRGIKTRVVRAEEDVVDGILRHAKAVGAGLIAMPTSSRGLSRALRGSIAGDVLRRAELPLLLQHVPAAV